VYISGKPLIVERTEIMPDSLVQALHLSGVKSVALFPVKSERKVLGVLGVVSTRHYIFTEEELDLFTLLGHHFGEVIQNSIYIEGTMDQAGEIKTAREGRRQFLNRISNDLGGPVMRIRTVIQTLTDDAGNREDRDVLRILGETSSDSEILERLIDDVRELADLDSEGGRLNAMPMDLMKELWRIKEQLQVKADDKEITLSLRYNHELEPVEADRDMIQSALRHMLSNAIKYTPEKGAVSIDAWEDNQMTYISIADTGIGIDEEASGKIFDMFYRASIARDLVKSGTGLGLTIVNRIVELHRGELVCRPGEGGGTVFVVKLPRMQLGEERQ
jgi:signal transduction histidine kinase